MGSNLVISSARHQSGDIGFEVHKEVLYSFYPIPKWFEFKSFYLSIYLLVFAVIKTIPSLLFKSLFTCDVINMYFARCTHDVIELYYTCVTEVNTHKAARITSRQARLIYLYDVPLFLAYSKRNHASQIHKFTSISFRHTRII